MAQELQQLLFSMVPTDKHIVPHPHSEGGLVLAPVTIDELFLEPVQINTSNGTRDGLANSSPIRLLEDSPINCFEVSFKANLQQLHNLCWAPWRPFRQSIILL